MVLDAAVDPNVLSYPMPIIMKERGAVVRRGGASLWTSGETGPALGRQARRSLAFIHRARRSPSSGVGRGEAQPSGVGRGGAQPLGLGEAESRL